MNASATMMLDDVLVKWERAPNASSVEEHRILRGNSPESLSTVGGVDDERHVFIDKAPVLEGEVLWYQVKAVDANGTVIATSPVVPVQPV